MGDLMKKIFIISFALFAFASCVAKDPLSSLNEGNKLFLLGDDESKISFMGWPNDGGKPSCNPDKMNQAYSFVIQDEKLLVESIRPSGTVRHNITQINSDGESIEIKAKNGANLPFVLRFTHIGENSANISFDGEADSAFIRCSR